MNYPAIFGFLKQGQSLKNIVYCNFSQNFNDYFVLNHPFMFIDNFSILLEAFYCPVHFKLFLV